MAKPAPKSLQARSRARFSARSTAQRGQHLAADGELVTEPVTPKAAPKAKVTKVEAAPVEEPKAEEAAPAEEKDAE